AERPEAVRFCQAVSPKRRMISASLSFRRSTISTGGIEKSMHAQRCVCPKCGTTLRVKDRGYLNRPIPCPDCRTLLVLRATNDDQLEATLAEPTSDADAKPAIHSRDAAAGQSMRLRLPVWMTNVTAVSWATALLLAAMIAGAAVWPRQRAIPTNSRIAAQQE